MIDWINRRFDVNLNAEQLDVIKDFTLLWNIYENRIFDTHFSIDELERKVRNSRFEIDEFEAILTYFQNRYVDGLSTNDRFGYLNFRRNDRQDLVEGVLLGNVTDNANKIIALGIIVYRLRNNLFHGVKNFEHLNGQVDNFTNANEYLKLWF